MFKIRPKRPDLFIFITVITLIIVRFVLIGMMPLFDKTESRYAEVARLMYETKEWVVLQIDYGIPFWAKPPLSTWLSAISFEIFGVNEFAARLPSFLLALIILYIVGKIARKSRFSFYLPAFILLTMPEFLIHMGVVSTDSVLAFSVILIMLSLWGTMNSYKRTFYGYLFFIAIGLGLLAKGPIVILLTVPPIFIWCCIKRNRLREVFSKLPWFSGILITGLIAIPWYYFAERRSPGFIDYFLVGEHFNRFFESGWQGDLYGSGHSQPIGMIWIFLLMFTFPWIQIVFYTLWKNKKTIFKDDWVSYLVLWLLWTPFFFTFSQNILHTYILPVLVPIVLLVIHWWKDYRKKNTIISVSSVFSFLVFIGFFIFLTGKFEYNMNTDKYLLENKKVDIIENNTPIFYWKQKSYSGQFYSKGSAKIIKNEKMLDSMLQKHSKLYFVLSNNSVTDVPQISEGKFILLNSNFKTSIYIHKTTP